MMDTMAIYHSPSLGNALPEIVQEEEEEDGEVEQQPHLTDQASNSRVARTSFEGYERVYDVLEEGDDEADASRAQVRSSSSSNSNNMREPRSTAASVQWSGPEAGSSTTPTQRSPKIPAAGTGTRVRPRPIPRSSTSLRHITSKGRTVSFGTSLPEDHAAGETAPSDTGSSTLQKRFEAAQRKNLEQLQSESAMESDAEDTDQDDQYETRRRKGTREGMVRTAKQKSDGTLNALTTSSEDRTDDSAAPQDAGDVEEDEYTPWYSASKKGEHYPSEGNGKGRSARAADGHPSPLMLASAQQTLAPGTNSLKDVHTPLETPPDNDEDSRIDPRHRLEWHTMLQSVLRSEVLKSETKRITSADAPSLTDKEVMYQRWLDIRASLRGRGQLKNAYEVELQRLQEGWPTLINHVLAAVERCRSAREEADNLLSDCQESAESKEHVKEEIGNLLTLVDSAEEQFPSLHKLAEVAPAYFEKQVQDKLAALYSWYNILNGLQLQLRILQNWTGSDTLDVQSAPTASSNASNTDETGRDPRQRLEEGTFLERLLKENSLQSTFEKRTLRALHQLIMKSKLAITEHHQAFAKMRLPTFEPELMQLINFPTRLMEAALRARLDYVGKLTDPSVLIVDSLIDDLRGAIALACRIKVQYTKMIVPDVENGWNVPQTMSESYDAVLREALRYFFKLLNYKLKGSLFFKETEILEPEWHFLSTAVEVIEGADVLVARSVTKMVNKLFIRIVNFFERELSAPSVRKPGNEQDAGHRALNAIAGGQNAAPKGPSIAGGLTKGQVRMTLDEKARWIHQVFDSVRIRSRKLLGFARDIRNRLENAAEYDLTSLRTPTEDRHAEQSYDAAVDGAPNLEPQANKMDLTQFLQTLIDAGFFLVLTGSFEQEGVYVIAEPSLHDRPEMVQDLFCKCMRQGRRGANDIVPGVTPKNKINTRLSPGEEAVRDDGSDADARDIIVSDDEEPPSYLLALSPRDAFMWTGRVMYLHIDRLDVDLKERRLRLIADGCESRLKRCQNHLYDVFGATHARMAASSFELDADELVIDSRQGDAESTFPLTVLDQSLAHMSAVQSELRQINKGVYMLTNAVIRAVPKIRRNLRLRRRSDHHIRGGIPRPPLRDADHEGAKGGDCDELIQTCFSRAAEQGLRALPFIESARLRSQTMLSLARLSIDWVAFICDDCEPTDRKTFKFAVAALEMAMFVTRAEEILNINEDDFLLLRSKVASCVGLLISHFDILGARDSAAKAKAEEERLERERADRSRALETSAAGNDADFRTEAVLAVQSSSAGAPPMLNRHDSGMQATEERWVQKVLEWDAARQAIESEQRLIGRVLDDTRLEDRGLQFLASSSSRIQIRWQQGRFIGGGTFGTVYLGVNLDSGGLMAVKEIRLQDINSTPTMYKQIKDEMSVMEMLSHPNIVEYYGIEVHRDKVYIFEEYCQGGSLAQLLEHGRIEDEMVSQVYTLQMLDGLVYLHSKDVVHRDIKPDNILLDHMGVIKFVDFGAAKVLAKNSRTIQLSRRPAVVGANAMAGMIGPDGKPGAAASLQGTPMYMSPEVIKGETRGRRGAMDVWSLGCVVLECATGHRPWSQLDNEWAIMFHIGMAQQHPPLPEPGQLSELGIDFIRQCLIIDPYERPSASEMREHPWIKNLVEELNAANEDEVGNGTTYPETPGVESGINFGSGFVHGSDSAAGVAAMAATPGTRTVNGFSFGRPPAPSYSNSALSSFSRGSSETSGASQMHTGTTPAKAPWQSSPTSEGVLFSTSTTVSGGDAGATPAEPHTKKDVHSLHDPGHPNHTHPGSEALIADLAYAEEEAQKRAMVAPSEVGDD